MAKEVHSVSDEGMSTTSSCRDFELTIDATGEESIDTLETLLADYAACYVPALRVGGRQRTPDLGGEATTGDVTVEADVDEETADAIVARANELCKVHDALKSSLHAEMTLRTA
ncbi:hypothetical protein BRC83_08535 [Halobacteriales archaeon QS_1_68_17]|nr:MAG: hypothetical protein BRC83_08535 [Halobacteriales archaeon QS_1_68_17]